MKLSVELLANEAVSRLDMRRLGMSREGEDSLLVERIGSTNRSSEKREYAGLSS